MSHLKNKNKGTPKPLKKERLLVANHFNAIINSYVDDEAQRKTIMSAFLAKKPKSYAQVNYKLYRFNSIILGVLHLISFLGAVSIVGYLQTLPIGTTAHVLSLVAVLFLIICEMGQHSMLNVAFEKWHATNNVPTRIGFMCVFFSAISIFSSAFGTYHFAQTYDLPSNTVVMGMLAISFVTEILILYTTLELHNYQKVVFQESTLVNDMYHQNEHSLFFDSMPNVQKMGTYLMDAQQGQNTPTLPTAPPPIQPIQAPPPRQNTPKEATPNLLQMAKDAAQKAVTPTPKKSLTLISVPTIRTAAAPTKKNTAKKKAKNTPKKGAKSVLMPSIGVKSWNLTDINTFLRSYENRIKKRTEKGLKPTAKQLIGKAFFAAVLSSHDFDKNGNFPYVAPEDRKDYFNNSKNTPT